MTAHITAGNVTKMTVTFNPESGVVNLSDVTAKLRKADGTEVVLLGISEVDVNQFRADYEVAEDDPPGFYTVRWESSSPSSRIVVEGLSTTFLVTTSVFITP